VSANTATPTDSPRRNLNPRHNIVMKLRNDNHGGGDLNLHEVAELALAFVGEISELMGAPRVGHFPGPAHYSKIAGSGDDVDKKVRLRRVYSVTVPNPSRRATDTWHEFDPDVFGAACHQPLRSPTTRSATDSQHRTPMRGSTGCDVGGDLLQGERVKLVAGTYKGAQGVVRRITTSRKSLGVLLDGTADVKTVRATSCRKIDNNSNVTGLFKVGDYVKILAGTHNRAEGTVQRITASGKSLEVLLDGLGQVKMFRATSCQKQRS